MGCFLDLLLHCFGGCLGIQPHDRRRSPKVSMNAMEPLKEKKEIAKLLGRPDLVHTETSHYEDVILDCEVVRNPGDIQVECDSHIDVVKKQSLFDQVILPLRRPELFPHNSKLLCDPQKGVFLHGPPSNTGKATLLATAKFIAKESEAVFIDARKIVNMLMTSFRDYDAAQKRQLLGAVFSLASKLQPAVIFINDMDGFLEQLSQTNMKDEFMELLDGFSTDQKHEHAQVMILAATSKYNGASPERDEAMKRHLTRNLEIWMPRRKERAKILNLILKGERVEDNIDYDHIAALTEGYTGSDLLQLCKKAAYIPIRDHLQYEEKSGSKQSLPPRPMSQSDLENVVIVQLSSYLNTLVQQAKRISVLLDQTHNEKHHHQLKRLMSSLALSYRGKDDSNVMEQTDGEAPKDKSREWPDSKRDIT